MPAEYTMPISLPFMELVDRMRTRVVVVMIRSLKSEGLMVPWGVAVGTGVGVPTICSYSALVSTRAKVPMIQPVFPALVT